MTRIDTHLSVWIIDFHIKQIIAQLGQICALRDPTLGINMRFIKVWLGRLFDHSKLPVTVRKCCGH